MHRGWEDTELNRYKRFAGAQRQGMKFWIGSFFVRNIIGRALLSLGFDCARSLHERGMSCQDSIRPAGFLGFVINRRLTLRDDVAESSLPIACFV